MIRNRHWHNLPSQKVRDALPHLKWQKTDDHSPGTNSAALMLYVALRFMADDLSSDEWVATANYDELEHATALSRKLISQGLQRLQALELIDAEGSNQKRRYRINWSEGGWFKLPCKAIVAGNAIRPFKAFTLRSSHELHALKLYLYLASIRDGRTLYSVATFETIYEKTGISERHITRAYSQLLACNLLAMVKQPDDQIGPNQYFLTGYGDLPQRAAAVL
jgi:hypothetical protein